MTTHPPQPVTKRPPEIQLIYERRDALGLSQAAAGKLAGISDTYWRMIEDGKRQLTGRRGLRTLARMADAVQVPAGEMAARGRRDIEGELARLRLSNAESIEQAQAEAERMVANVSGLSERQRRALQKLVTEDIREVRENG